MDTFFISHPSFSCSLQIRFSSPSQDRFGNRSCRGLSAASFLGAMSPSGGAPLPACTSSPWPPILQGGAPRLLSATCLSGCGRLLLQHGTAGRTRLESRRLTQAGGKGRDPSGEECQPAEKPLLQTQHDLILQVSISSVIESEPVHGSHPWLRCFQCIGKKCILFYILKINKAL